MTLAQEAARLARVLADRSRKQEIFSAGSDIGINGATFDAKQFQEIIRRATQLATALREFDEPRVSIAELINGPKRAGIIEFTTGLKADKAVIDLSAARRVTLEEDMMGEGVLVIETGEDQTTSWTLEPDEVKRLDRELRAQPGFLTVYSSTTRISLTLVEVDQILAAVATHTGNLAVYFKDGSCESYGTDRAQQAIKDLATALKQKA